jgi:gamma-glutamylcyclotransferase (GGCT)/AIG2-like uncharacterized protein YtfP
MPDHFGHDRWFHAVDYSAMERLPFFVYGTLRPNFGNAALWRDRGRAMHDGVARVRGYRLVMRSHAWFPYAVADATATSVGALVVPDPIAYSAVAQRLDALEGYPHHYDRVQAIVDTPDGEVTAWIYTPGFVDDGMTDVPGNDWANIAKHTGGYRMVTR